MSHLGDSTPATTTSRPPCPFYQHGLCLLGPGCRLSHDPVIASPPKVSQLLKQPAFQPDCNGDCQGSNTTKILSSDTYNNNLPLNYEAEERSAPRRVPRNAVMITPRNQSRVLMAPVNAGLSVQNLVAVTTESEEATSVFCRRPKPMVAEPQFGGTIRYQEPVVAAAPIFPGGCGRGLGLAAYQPLRRPGGNVVETVAVAEKTFYCHQCKQDIPSVRGDLSCPLCWGEFIEESTTVERPVENVRGGAELGAIPKVRKTSVASLEPDGFAWVPPAHLFQAFLPYEDKLMAFADPNPYIYLDDQDAVDADFPSLESPLSPELDERILAKELNKQRLLSCTSVATGGSLDDNSCWEDDEEESDAKRGEENNGGDVGPSSQQQAGGKKLSKGQKRRKRKETLRIRKSKEKEEQQRKEAERKEKKERLEKIKEEERQNKAEIRKMQELESKMRRCKIAQNLQQHE